MNVTRLQNTHTNFFFNFYILATATYLKSIYSSLCASLFISLSPFPQYKKYCLDLMSTCTYLILCLSLNFLTSHSLCASLKSRFFYICHLMETSSLRSLWVSNAIHIFQGSSYWNSQLHTILLIALYLKSSSLLDSLAPTLIFLISSVFFFSCLPHILFYLFCWNCYLTALFVLYNLSLNLFLCIYSYGHHYH